MKTKHLNHSPSLAAISITCCILISIITGCKKNSSNPPSPSSVSYQQVNLASDSGFSAVNTDAKLLNAWGIAIGPTGAFWISDNHSGYTTIYDKTGTTLLAPITIPTVGGAAGGSPTGVIFNSTSDFIISSKLKVSKFIYAGEDGIVSAWGAGEAAAMIVADQSAAGAVYKGIAMANDGANNFIYLADFKNSKVDVFDKNFNLVTNKPFLDQSIPSGFAPFNIQNIGGKLYISYAKHLAPDNHDDEKGVGNGIVNIFNPDGSLVKRFASNGTLNSPWGIAAAPATFGLGANKILIGNFGDGMINIFDANGNFQGELQDKGSAIKIDGLWALSFEDINIAGSDPNLLYFTAGPVQENHGLFGYLKMR